TGARTGPGDSSQEDTAAVTSGHGSGSCGGADGGIVGIVGSRGQEHPFRNGGLSGLEASSDSPGESSNTAEGSAVASAVNAGRPPWGTPYLLVRDAAGLSPVLQALDESAVVGVDCETTGLDPRRDRARLLQLSTERGVFVLDLFQVDARPLFDLLA